MADNELVTRRRATKRIAVAGGTLFAPSFVGVARAETDSGYPEVSTTATIKNDTRAYVTVYEDPDQDGNAENSQKIGVLDGEATYVLEALRGYDGSSNDYWLEVELQTDETGGSGGSPTDDAKTPTIDSITVTVPADEPPRGTREDGPAGIRGLLDNPLVTIMAAVLGTTAVGLGSRSMAIGAWGGFLMFVHLGLNSGYYIFEQLTYIAIAMICLGIGFKLWRLEALGE